MSKKITRPVSILLTILPVICGVFTALPFTAGAAVSQINIPKSGNANLDLSAESVGCSVKVYDSGGAEADYESSSDGTLTITPPQGKALKIQGTVSTEQNYDFFYIYAGSVGDGNELAVYNGNNNKVDSYYTESPIIFRLKSDSSVVKSGVDLAVTVTEVFEATYEPGDGSGTMPAETVFAGVPFELPECDFTVPEGKLFAGWKAPDGQTYLSGDKAVVYGDTAFTAQYSDPCTVSFDSGGGSGSMSNVTVAQGAAFRLPESTFIPSAFRTFGAWKCSLDGQTYKTGEKATVTGDATFTAQWTYGDDFERSGDQLEGWTVEYEDDTFQWEKGLGDHYENTGAHSGSQNAKAFFGTKLEKATYLVTPAIDLSHIASASVGFWYINRKWVSDIDYFGVYYRVNGGTWNELFYTEINHESWTQQSVDLPSAALVENVQVGFYAFSRYGHGVGLDDVFFDLTPETHTITWKNDDGCEIDQTTVDYGATPTHADATKEADAEFTYTFEGWKDSQGTLYAKGTNLPAVTGDAAYTASFTATDNKYTVTWKNEGVEDPLEVDTDVIYGETSSYDSAEPTKASSADGVRYVFTGWTDGENTYDKDGDMPVVTRDLTFTATYKTQYLITWDKANGTDNETEWVDAGTTPAYSGTDPEKAADEQYSYTFDKWEPTPEAATEPKTYTATYTAKSKKIIRGESLTLDGNVTVNFHIDPSAADLTPEQVATEPQTFDVTFAWKEDNKQKSVISAYNTTVEVNGNNYEEVGDLIPVSCDVCAAEMTCDIDVTVKFKDKEPATETYCVRDYGKTVLDKDSDFSVKYKNEQGEDKYNKLCDLVKAMLNYGTKAQKVFGVKTGDLANDFFNPEDEMADVTDTMFDNAIKNANIDETDNRFGKDINAVAESLGAKWYTTSVYFLQYNKIRHVFTKANDSFNPSAYPNNQKNFYYYVQSENGIPAAELDTLQTFTIGNTTFRYSVLDYAKALAKSTKNTPAQNDLAKAVYWYNQAANAFFENVVDLSTLNGDYKAQDGDVLTGTLSGNKKITVAAGATVTLRDLNITSLDNSQTAAPFAGINPLGDASIILEGSNIVIGGHKFYPGVLAPEDHTLTIGGSGKLEAFSNGAGSGIGSAAYQVTGNIVINGGDITAVGGSGAAGIGTPQLASNKVCGSITINGGKVTALGGKVPSSGTYQNAPGIGSGHNARCGDITITGGTVVATGGLDAAGIGSGESASCGNITITGGTVTANGGRLSPGIGSGRYANCGDIMITKTVTQVTATKGSNAARSIGAGDIAACGTVTIEEGANVIQN